MVKSHVCFLRKAQSKYLPSQSHLEFFLGCQDRNKEIVQRGAAKFPEWSCKARVVLNIKSHNRKAKTHLSLEYERKFDAIGLGWGCERFGTLKVPY